MLPRHWRAKSKRGKDAGSLDSRSYRGDRGRRIAPLCSRQGRGGHLPRGHSVSKFAERGEICLSRGQVHDERGALAGLRADGEAASHPGDELARDEEAEATAADAAGERRIEAIELLEDPFVLRRRYAEAAVADRQPDTAVATVELDDHVPAVRRVLDRVVEQVDENLPELVLVGERDRGSAVLLPPQLDLLRSAPAGPVGRALDEGFQVGRGSRHVHPPLLELAREEDLGDDRR